MKTLMASLLALAFLAAPVLSTGAQAAEDTPSTPVPAEDQNSSSAPQSGNSHGGKRCGGASPSV